MSLVLNTNINALTTQNSLNKSQMSLTEAMQRLSSGLRINSAADDAAGLAIATRMTTQVNGLTQASQNANDGISLAQTAEGALGELNNNLQAIRELAVESANATNSASDRAAIDQEVQQRLQEVDRIATQTTFNGQHVLDGTLGSATFQVGANVGETIGINLTSNMKTSSIGSLATTASTGSIAGLFSNGAGLTLAAGALQVNTGAGAVSVAAATYTTAASLVTAINTAAGSGIATLSGNEIQITNTSTTNTIAFTGTAAAAVGLGTVAHATAGAAATPASYQSGTISSFDFSQAAVAATHGSYDTGALSSLDFSTGTNTFTVDGNAVALTTDYTGDAAGLAADVQTKLNTDAPGIYTVAANGGGTGIVITKAATGVASTAPAIVNTGSGVDFSGGTGTGGADAIATTNKHFSVDGTGVDLTTNVTDVAGLVNAVQTALGGTYAVSASGGGIKIALVAAGAHAAPAIGGADAAFITTGGSGTAGTATGATINTVATSTGVNSSVTHPGTLTLNTGDFTLQVGTSAVVDLAGTYNTSQDFADAINSKVPGMYASIDASGQLNLSAADTITVGGTKAGAGATNLNFGTVATPIAVSGNLRGTDVLTVADANNMIQRIDSALTAVSNYNSILGAIQNRFQSAINSDSAASQNITAARSRVQDADFAAETTKMTSSNILQQAGVSVLAQANSSQQSILKLLQ